MKKTFKDLPFRVDYEAQISTPPNAKRVFVLLHGFEQDAKFIFEKIKDIIPKDCAILAPNGPLSIPVKKKDKYEVKYAWYFFDPILKKYFIDFLPSSEFIKSMLIELNLINLPVTVIGYSQGGYLAPKLAEIVSDVDTVIGLACCFRNEKFEYRKSVMIHQINSESDMIIDYNNAKEEFYKLRERGNVGRMVTLEGVNHRLTDEYLQEIKNLI